MLRWGSNTDGDPGAGRQSREGAPARGRSVPRCRGAVDHRRPETDPPGTPRTAARDGQWQVLVALRPPGRRSTEGLRSSRMALEEGCARGAPCRCICTAATLVFTESASLFGGVLEGS